MSKALWFLHWLLLHLQYTKTSKIYKVLNCIAHQSSNEQTDIRSNEVQVQSNLWRENFSKELRVFTAIARLYKTGLVQPGILHPATWWHRVGVEKNSHIIQRGTHRYLYICKAQKVKKKSFVILTTVHSSTRFLNTNPKCLKKVFCCCKTKRAN